MPLKALKQNFYLLSAPMALVIIACLQIYNAHFRNLTAWEGGGFGMFSGVDSLESRYLRCTLVTDSGEFLVAVPNHLQHLTMKMIAIPTPELLSDFARRLAQMPWVTAQVTSSSEAAGEIADSQPEYKMVLLEEYDLHFPFRPQPDPSSAAVILSVRVEVIRRVFDAQSLRLSAEKIVTVTENRELY